MMVKRLESKYAESVWMEIGVDRRAWMKQMGAHVQK